MVACTGIEPMTLVLSALSTFTLMQEKLWNQLKGNTPSVLTSTTQRFVMTDGTIHQSRDLKNIFYHWHDRLSINCWTGLSDCHKSCLGCRGRQIWIKGWKIIYLLTIFTIIETWWTEYILCTEPFSCSCQDKPSNTKPAGFLESTQVPKPVIL